MPRKPKKLESKELTHLSLSSFDKANVVHKRSASASNEYLNYRDIVPDITVKNTYSDKDYYEFRETEQLPCTPKGIMAMAMKYYKTNAIVKNTIDMMAEFSAGGMVVAHKSERIQSLYQNWLDKLKYYEINEQFVRVLLKTGNTVIHRSFTQVNKATVNELYIGMADTDFPKVKYVKNEIPIGYSFLNPLQVTLPNEEIAAFTGKRAFSLKLPESLIKQVKKMTKDELKVFYKEFPPEIVDYLRRGKTEIPLDPYKTSVFQYKKDDWEIWGEPIHACILDDLIHFDKAKLADRTTLDSLASRIRVWKLGHLEKDNTIMPSDAAYEKLIDILGTIPSGGIADILWNAAIDVLEVAKDDYKFLQDNSKYRAPLNNIYQGLGVPRTVNDDNSFNNNYFGLKTMVERLNYARSILKSFWTEEFKMIHKALGLSGDVPIVMFDEISITDRAQMMALVRDLVDRNVISEQECQRLFNTVPDIESYRIKKENRRKENDSMPPKAGPFHTNNKAEMKKIALTKGIVHPKDVGVDSSLSDKQIMSIVKPKPKGQPGQGRPKNSRDKNGRKKRAVKPRSAMANLWYIEAQNKIHDFLVAKSLEKFGKKNVRQLATAETDQIEKDKFALMYNVSFGSKLDEIDLNGVSISVSPEAVNQYNLLVANFVKTFGRQPNINEQRILQVEVCLNKE